MAASLPLFVEKNPDYQGPVWIAALCLDKAPKPVHLMGKAYVTEDWGLLSNDAPYPYVQGRVMCMELLREHPEATFVFLSTRPITVTEGLGFRKIDVAAIPDPLMLWGIRESEKWRLYVL